MKPPILFRLLFIGIICLACNNNFTITEQSTKRCSIYPNYKGITIPYNICPLNFYVDSVETGFVRFESNVTKNYIDTKISNHKIDINPKDWSRILQETKGNRLYVSVVDENGVSYQQFVMIVANEPIDKYVAYRLLAPAFKHWGEMGIYQRDLETFKEHTVVESKNSEFACVNCHSFANRKTDQMMFHVRMTDYAGTYVWHEGEMDKLNTKTPQTISPLVYPSWHPSGKYIAFSVNKTGLTFYVNSNNKMEVYDSRSDVVIYDVEKHELITSEQLFNKAQFETFPSFSPNGKQLYFCSADTVPMPAKYDDVKYALCAIDFNPETRELGTTVDTIFKDQRLSATLPRISPNGEYLLFTAAKFGNFHISHKSADLWIYNMKNGKTYNASRWNSNDVDSYHSWSDNSRWVVFSSKRDDGVHTRLYIAYIGEDGKLGVPFMLPQKDPLFNKKFRKAYNIPEFVIDKIEYKGYEIRNPDSAIQIQFVTDIPTDVTSGASQKL